MNHIFKTISKKIKGRANADFYKDKAGNFYLKGNKPP